MKRIKFFLAVAAIFCAFCIFAAEPGKTTENKSQEKMKMEQDMQTVCKFIKDAGHYFIATVEDGQPRVRPFGTIHIFEGKLYIQTGKKKNVFKQIAANPKVELCTMKGKEWIRLSGTLVVDNRIEAKKSMLDAYPELKNLYKAEDENTQVLYFKDATATIYSFGGAPKVYKIK